MSRFKGIINSNKNYPFMGIDGSINDGYIYLRMEAIPTLLKDMKTIRDVALIIDASETMKEYYENGYLENIVKKISEEVLPFDDDGIDLFFFSDGLIHHEVLTAENNISNIFSTLKLSDKIFKKSLPTEAFNKFSNQLKEKKRSGLVLFLTNGIMSDGGEELRYFYKDILHRDFTYRDNFYCYALEFGRKEIESLKLLDRMYQPEQGPEDLFDVDPIENVEGIIEHVLRQVVGMSSIGSDIIMNAWVDGQAQIEMVNSDLMPTGVNKIQGSINQMIYFKISANKEFNMKIKIESFDEMNIKITPNGNQTNIEY